MKIGNKGFAISSIMYLILVMALIIVAILLSLLSSRKLVLDKQKKTIIDKYAQEDINSFTYEANDFFIASKTGLYKFQLCGAKVSGVNGSCVSGFKNLNRGDGLSISISTSSSISYSSYTVIYAAAGNSQNINDNCGGSFISGDRDCNSSVPSFIFSNTEINKKTNINNAYVNIIYIGS